MWAALAHDAYYLTAEPHLVPAVVAPEVVHVNPLDDA